MKRTFSLTLISLAAAVLFAGLVYAVLRVAHLSEPAATTIHGATGRRLWATSVVLLALASVSVCVVALARSASRFTTVPWRFGTLIIGLIATVNGVLVLTLATGGPGSGNGVVGGAAALVLGLAATAMAGKGLARSRPSC